MTAHGNCGIVHRELSRQSSAARIARKFGKNPSSERLDLFFCSILMCVQHLSGARFAPAPS